MNTRPLLLAALLAAPFAPPLMAQAADAPDSATRAQADTQRRLDDAQKRLEQAAQEVAELSLRVDDAPLRVFRTEQRPMLGLSIDVNAAQEQGQTLGVRIISVSPGGPAANSGLRANDVIVSIAGKALRGESGQGPAEQLLAQLRQAKADMPLALEYRRDGKVTKVQVTPKLLSDESIGMELPALPELPGGLELRGGVGGGGGGRGFVFGANRLSGPLSGFGSAELAELSPALGKYFGTDKGLLVVRAPSDEKFKLQDGDVILDIDGRVPSNVAHAYQILNSYRDGETLKLHVMRQQKKLELPIEVPNAPTGKGEGRREPSAHQFIFTKPDDDAA
ncbi:MAG: PDZ domain-containing protein [Steroidobacteraceae bacterium]